MFNLKIIALNVNSLIAIRKRHFLDHFLKENRPDIVLVCETRLKPKFKLSFKNYKIVRSDRPNSPGGGCAILVRENIEFEIFKINNISTLEYCSIVVTNTLNNKQIHICSIYNKSCQLDISEDLSTIFCSLNVDAVVGGDFNSKNEAWGDSKNNKSGTIVKKWLDDNDGVYNISHLPTFTPTRENSYLDFFIISNNLNVQYSNNHPLFLKTIPYDSDHMAVELILQNHRMVQALPKKALDFSNTDFLKFRRIIDSNIQQHILDEDRNLTNNEIVDALNKFNSLMKKAIESAVPTIIVKERGLIKLRDITLKLIEQKKKLRRRLFRTNDNSLKPLINHLDILIKEQVKITYDDYWAKRFSSIKVDQDTFKNVKNLAGIKRNHELPNLLVNTVILNDTKEKVDVLAEKFSDIHRQNNNMIDPELTIEVENCAQLLENPAPLFHFNHQMRSSKTDNPQDNLIYNQFLDVKEFNDILKSRNNKKSAGNDLVPMYLLKKTPDSLRKFLVILFNNIYNNAFFPPSWKEALITPIAKPYKNPQSPDSYRPISLLPNVSKLFEEFIHLKIIDHVNTNNIYKDFQFGFRRYHSTNHALAIFTSNITAGLNKRIGTLAVSLDTEKAFDTAWRKGIIFKMKSTYKFPDHICSIVQSYLTGRTFKVKHEDVTSKIVSADEGVPQGSILGPVLFNLYTMDIPAPDNTDTKVIAYADDILIYSTKLKLREAEHNVNAYLKKYKEFTDKWRLRVNASKCEAIKFYKNSSYPNTKRLKPKITFGNIRIKNSKVIKYLGLNIKSNLNFTGHINFILKKCNAALALYYKLLSKFSLSKKVKLLIYKQIFRTAISYAFPSWFNISTFGMERLRKFERKCLRHCTGLNFKTINKRYKNIDIYKEAKIIRIDNYLIQLCKNFLEKLPTVKNDLISNLCNDNNVSLNDSLYDVRHLKKLFIENRFYNNQNEIIYYNGRHDSAQYVV